MADGIEKTALLTINTNAAEVTAQVLQLGKELDELKEKQEKAGKGTKEYVQFGSDIRNTAADIRGLNKDLDNLGKMNKLTEGSVAAMRAQYALSVKEWNNADAVNREKLTPGVLAQAEALKKLEKTVGDNRREVGNYAIAGLSLKEQLGSLESVIGVKLVGSFHALKDGIAQASKGFSKMKTEQTAAVHGAQELAAAKKMLTSATKLETEAELAFGEGQISTTELMAARTAKQEAQIAVDKAQVVATETLTIAQRGLNAVMSGGVIGILVLALAGLIAYLTQTYEGSKVLQRGIAALNGIFQALLGVITPIGKAISDSFGGTEGIIKSFGGAISLVITPLVTLAKVFYDLSQGHFKDALQDGTDGLKKMGQATIDTLNGVVNLANGITNGIAAGVKAVQGLDLSKAARAGTEAAAARQKQVEAEREYGVTQVKVEGEIEALKIKAARRDLQAGERQKALNEARKLENGLLTDKVKLAKSNLSITEQEEKLQSKKDPEKQAEAQKRLNEAQAQQAVGEANLDRIEGRINQRRTKDGDKAEAEIKKLDEVRLASLARQQEATEDARAKELTQLDEFFRKEQDKIKDNVKGAETARAQLRAEESAKRSQLNEKFAKEDQLKLEAIQKEAATVAVANIKDAQVKMITAIDQGTADRLRKIDDANELTRTQVLKQQAAIQELRKAGNTVEADELQAAMGRELNLMAQNNNLAADLVQAGEKQKQDVRKKFLQDEAIERAEAEKLDAGKNLDQGYTAELDLLTAKYAKERDMADQQGKDLTKIDAKYKADMRTADLNYNVGKAELTKQQIGQYASVAQGLEGMVKKGSAAYKALFLAQKALAIATIVIDSNVARMKTTAAYPPPLDVVPNAKITIQEIFSVASVAATALKFNRGGFVSDNRGSMVSGAGTGTSDSIPAYLSNGESVINAKSTEMFGPILSRINEIGGGRAFAAPYAGKAFAQGGIYSDGGSAARYYAQPVSTNSNLANSLADQLINNPQPIYVDVKEINSVQSRVAQVQNRVNL